MPSSGGRREAPGAGRAARARGGSWSCCPMAGAGCGAGAGSPSIVQDRRGIVNESVGSRPKTPRATACSIFSTASRPNRGDRDAQKRCPLDDFSGAVLGGPRADDGVPFGGALLTRRDAPPLTLEQVGSLDEQAERVELLAGVGIEADPTVRARLDRRQFDRACRLGPAAGVRRDSLTDRRSCCRWRFRDLAQRQVDEIAEARTLVSRRTEAGMATAA